MIAIIIKQFFGQDESGQGLVEYGLLVSLIALVVIGAMVTLGGNVTAIFTAAGDALTP
jgi:pilus assembly protein Flp/PilA